MGSQTMGSQTMGSNSVADSLYDSEEWFAWVTGIRENPEDDLRRLVAADWLEERGEGYRGRWIRGQVRNVAQMVPLSVRIAFESMMRVQPHMMIAHGGRGAARLQAGTGLVMGFDRGFIQSVRCPWSWWAEHGDTLCRREPVVKVELTEAVGEFECKSVGGYPPDTDPLHIAGRLVGVKRGASKAEELSARWPAIPFEGWVLPRPNEFANINRTLERIQQTAGTR
jgi:uncharacterized protein (TIGR02996 family)